MEEKVKAVMLSAAKAAGERMKSRSQGSFQVDHKEGRNNLVTEVDLECEKIIVSQIQESFPDHAILSEEAGTLGKESSYRWIIDPIDGTTNFAHGLPLCCVSIGWEKEGKMALGAVYNPFMEELFFAQGGQGAWRNGQAIRVSDQPSLQSSFLVTGFPYHWPKQEGDGPMEVFSSLVKEGIPVRRLGSAALDLCWVACGRFDGFWEYELQPWDLAAGYLIIEEAGGRVTDFHGKDARISDRQTLATNGKIHDQMMKWIEPFLRGKSS